LTRGAAVALMARVMQGLSQVTPGDAAGALGWLVAAGVDTPVDAAPRQWLRDVVVAGRDAEPLSQAQRPAHPGPGRATQRATSPSPGGSTALTIAEAPTLEALAEIVAAFDHPLRRADMAPCLLAGNAASGVIIVCDQPEADGSPAAALRDRMLAAIGLDSGSCALLYRLPWPTTGGRTPRADELAAFAAFVAHVLVLARPRLLLALGQAAAALAGEPMALTSARGRWADVCVGGAAVPLLATCHPRLLLTQPLRKREAWADLQAFAARLVDPA
jgi:uracil-DNA glycosylase